VQLSSLQPSTITITTLGFGYSDVIEHGTVAELQQYCGIDVNSLEQLLLVF
jgi:hypothetical protein